MSIPTHMNPHVEPGAGKFDSKSLLAASVKLSKAGFPSSLPKTNSARRLKKHSITAVTSPSRAKTARFSKAISSIASLVLRCKPHSCAFCQKIPEIAKKSPIRTSLRSLLAAATLPQARVGKPGSRNTGKRRRRVVPEQACIQTPSSRSSFLTILLNSLVSTTYRR